MRLTFLGDIHGHYTELLQDCEENKKADRIYQLGDFGFGFSLPNQPDLGIGSTVFSAESAVELPANLRILRGNHDCPATMAGHPNYIGDYGVDDLGVGYVSGAMSVDKNVRTPGLDWWPEEELSLSNLNRAVDLLIAMKPRIIITHTAPYAFEFFLEKWPKVGRTNQALDELWKYHAPEIWICGHHHVNEVKRLKETIFCCVNQNKGLSLEVKEGSPIKMSDIIFL
jgi:predicted phosphodiesterase